MNSCKVQVKMCFGASQEGGKEAQLTEPGALDLVVVQEAWIRGKWGLDLAQRRAELNLLTAERKCFKYCTQM